MKLALLSDIHANLPALEAVLAHARQSGAKMVWNLGDFTGYGPFPDEVVKAMKKVKATSIAGNYDLKVLRAGRKKKALSAEPEKALAFRWAFRHLSGKSKTYLKQLPLKRLKKMAGWRILLTHSSPVSIEEHLSAATPEERLRYLASQTSADVILCGHSHQPFARLVEKTWFINPGSVGRPDDGDNRASYAILVIKKNLLEVVHYRVNYDIERTATALESAGLPVDFTLMIRQGKSLDNLSPERTAGSSGGVELQSPEPSSPKPRLARNKPVRPVPTPETPPHGKAGVPS